MSRRLPLSGLKVVAVEQAVAAPFCTARLADAGAHVIKIERPEGDFARGYDEAAGGLSSYFVWLNRGKHSVVLDLASNNGKNEFARLVATADVVVQNLKPGALAKLGFAPDRLRAQNPAQIICSISGYGDHGPMADRKAYDLLIQAESGLSSITGGPDGPARVGISVVDIATGATAHAAILEALVGRAIDGQGADIRVSMFDVMAEWLTVPLLQAESGKAPARLGLSHPSIAPYGVFVAGDGGMVLLSIQSDREWCGFCSKLLGDESLGTDPLFATNLRRVEHRKRTDALVAEVFGRMTSQEAEQRLAAADLAFARVNDLTGLATHPHLRRITLETENGTIAIPAPAPIFDGMERHFGKVPALGER